MTKERIWERFWSHVTRGAGCWEWTGCKIDGYGQFRISQQKAIAAHRFAYELLIGPIPKGLTLDHLCRNRGCVRPSHVEPVTQRVNILRGNGIAAGNLAKKHCPLGHPYSVENTYAYGRTRRCKTCHARHKRRWYDTHRRNRGHRNGTTLSKRFS